MSIANMNSVAIEGRLTAKPELRTTSGGTSVCTFIIACNREYVPQGQERQTDWIDCIVWGKTAEYMANNVPKGTLISVQGNLQTSQFEDKNGNKRKKMEVNVQHFYRLSWDDKRSEDDPKDNPEDGPIVLDDDEDLPF